MTDQQFKKLGSWFQRLNRKMDETRKDLSDKMDFKFERVYRLIDEVKTRLTDLENRFEDYTSSEQKEIKIFRLALSKLEDRVDSLSAQSH